MTRTTARRRLVALLLCCGLLAAFGATADAKPKPPNPTESGKLAAAAADPLTPGQFSYVMPPALRDEVTSFFNGRPYFERLRAEGSDGTSQVNLKFYEPPSVGGGVDRSVSTDLQLPPEEITDILQIQMFDRWTNFNTKSCVGCFNGVSEAFHLRTMYLARSNAQGDYEGPTFFTGSKGNNLNDGDPDRYRNILYALSPEAICAVETCVEHVDLPNYYPDGPDQARIIGVTALAAGRVGDRLMVAVGLTDGGVSLFDEELSYLGSFGGMATGDGSQTPVTALQFDPAGSGWLAVGAMSHASIGFFVKLNSTGTVVPSTFNTWNQQGDDNLDAVPLSVAFGHDADGDLVAAFGLNAGRVALVDPTVNNGGAITTFTLPNLPNPQPGVSTITPVPRVDGSSGGSDWAVTLQQPGDFPAGFGALVRFSGTSGSLQPLRPAAGSDDGTLLGSLDEFRDWFPGYKLGALAVRNGTGETVQVSLLTRPEGGYGCWYAPASRFPAFPTDGMTLAPDDDTDLHTTGAYTAGDLGLCGPGPDDTVSARRGYLVITPVNHPADTRIVNVTLKPDFTIDTSDQIGGSVSIDPGSDFGPDGPYPFLSVMARSSAQPAAAVPTVTGKLLTRPTPGRNSVYRIDVGPMSWSVPGVAANQQQAALPPLQVQASVDGTTWTNVGQFMPVNTLNQKGTTVTSGTPATGSGSFYWENATGQPKYAQLRVVAGSTPSAAIQLGSLQPPAVPAAPVTSIAVTPAKSAVTTATPAANGVDQAPLLVAIGAGTTLPATDPAYDTVYYRDESNNLVTNLYQPGDYDDFLGVQPTAGAYPNTGSVSRTRRAVRGGTAYDYVSAAGAVQHKINGYVGTATSTTRSGAVTVQGTALDIGPDPNNAKASLGFSLEGCADYSTGDACQLAPVTPGNRAALYQAGDATQGPLIGAQLQVQATNALTDLPLQWSAKITQRKLASSPVTVGATKATMTDRTGFTPQYNVDTWLVSHGELIPITGIPVGGN